MSSNNRPWKEVNLIRRYGEKNLSRLSKQDMEELDEGFIQNISNSIGNLKTKVANNQAARATKKANAAQQKATAAQTKADEAFISNFAKQLQGLENTYNPSTPQNWLATAIKNDTNGTFRNKVGELSAVAISNGIENFIVNSEKQNQLNSERIIGIEAQINNLSNSYEKGSFDKISNYVNTLKTKYSSSTQQPAETETPEPASQPAPQPGSKTPKSKESETDLKKLWGDVEGGEDPAAFGESLHRKSPNRLKESRGLNILSIQLEDKVVCPDRYYDDEACEAFSSYEDFEEICKDYRDSVEPNDYEYDDMELILPKAVISYLEDGVEKSDRVSLGISVIANSAIGVEIDDYLEVFFNNSFNGETIKVGRDGIESLLNTGVLNLN